MATDWSKFAETVFGIDLTIRYVGVVDSEYHLLISKTREGVKSIISDETDRKYMPIAPPIVLQAFENLEQFIGNLEGVMARYEKLVFLFFRHETNIVILTAETKTETPLLTKVAHMLQEMSSK